MCHVLPWLSNYSGTEAAESDTRSWVTLPLVRLNQSCRARQSFHGMYSGDTVNALSGSDDRGRRHQIENRAI